MAVDRGRETEEPPRRHHRKERLAPRRANNRPHPSRKREELVDAAVEPHREFLRRAVGEHGHSAGDGERLLAPAGFDAERDDTPLKLARGGRSWVRRVGGADYHEAVDPRRLDLGQGQANHSAIGRADDGDRPLYSDCVQHRGEHPRLVEGGRRDFAASSAAKSIPMMQ